MVNKYSEYSKKLVLNFCIFYFEFYNFYKYLIYYILSHKCVMNLLQSIILNNMVNVTDCVLYFIHHGKVIDCSLLSENLWIQSAK